MLLIQTPQVISGYEERSFLAIFCFFTSNEAIGASLLIAREYQRPVSPGLRCVLDFLGKPLFAKVLISLDAQSVRQRAHQQYQSGD